VPTIAGPRGRTTAAAGATLAWSAGMRRGARGSGGRQEDALDRPPAGPVTARPPRAWPPVNRWGAGRVVVLVLGILILLPGIGLLAGGAALFWSDRADRTDDGYLFSARDAFSTGGYALASERIDLVTGADWFPLSAALGTARIEVTAADPTADLFIGIAPLADGSAYLEGVERTVIADVGVDASPADQVLVPGGAPSGPPTDQDFWAAQSSGPGAQQISWKPAQGAWMLVVMNADGSARVSVDARIGATVPALGGLAWVLLGAGLCCVLIGVPVIALAIRRRPAGRPGPRPGGAVAPAPAASPSEATPRAAPPD
jgi:hypothetical protein